MARRATYQVSSSRRLYISGIQESEVRFFPFRWMYEVFYMTEQANVITEYLMESSDHLGLNRFVFLKV